MLHNISEKSKRRILLVLDLLAIVLGYVMAYWARFAFHMLAWQSQLYRSVLVFTLLAYLFLYTYRHVRGHFYDIQRMDLLENLVRVIRDIILLYLIVIVFLGLTHSMGQISRRFLLVMACMDLVLDYAFRIIYREALLRSGGKEEARDRFLLVTKQEFSKVALYRLRDGLLTGKGNESADAAIVGMVWADAAEEAIRGGNGRFNRVYIYLPDSSQAEISEIIAWCDEAGVVADVALTLQGNGIPRKMVRRGSGAELGGTEGEQAHYAVAEYTNMKARSTVLGVNFCVSNVEAAAQFILGHLHSLQGRYVCFCNVHTTVMARENEDYRRIQNGAAYTFADGAPVAAVERFRGDAGAERCAGPDFMDAVFRATMDGSVGHYFYGSTPETVALLKTNLEKKYPGIRICGVYSPPFRKLEETAPEEDAAEIRRINESGAEIVWIGLGAPKQERWMALHEGKLSGTMFGVGAGFNFYAGNVRRAPVWVQKIGMEWLYRLFQDPKRLFNRYFTTNVKFVWYLLTDSFRKR